MPSLRRTASNPLVARSSPYRSLSSLTGAQVARGHGRRRVSGSDITSRRVLADIDWWKVTDGQCENGSGDFVEGQPTNDDDENNASPGMTSSNTLLNFENGVDHLLLPAALWPSDDSPSDVPTAEFAALSIAPRTPTRRPRRAPQSTSSSLESTPEPAVLTIEGLNLGLSDMGMFDDHAAFVAFEPAAIPSPPRLARAHTFADVFSLEDQFPSFDSESPLPNLLSLPAFVI